MFWHHPGSTSLQSKCLKWGISPSSHRSTRMAPQRTTVPAQTTCPMTILILAELTHWQNNPLKPLISFPFHLQIHHPFSLHLHPPPKQAPHLPQPLKTAMPSLPPSLLGYGPQKKCTHICNLFCDTDANGLFSTRLDKLNLRFTAIASG